MRLNATVLVAFLAIAAIALPVFAQPEGGPPPPPGPREEGGPRPPRPDDHRRDGNRPDSNSMSDDEIHELVSTIIMVRISRNLELNDEQTVLLVRNLQDMREKISGLYRERERTYKEMRALSENTEATDEELSAKLEQMMELDQKRSDIKREVFEQTAEGMSVKQKAKLYVTLQEFEWQMRRLVQRAKEMTDEELRKMRDEWGEGGRNPGDHPLVQQFMKNRRPDGPPPVKPEKEAAEAPKP
ncbi:MAG TPA: hypothetical protein PLJ47_07620 [Candidatus Hydrogenedentes bacterium]|nr:hypothetical protein [Candidatus Hydrogenedentota bacterium]HRK34450.1 hypothetical protein [Candidatus Hydrogenedentota bacterium]